MHTTTTTTTNTDTKQTQTQHTQSHNSSNKTLIRSNCCRFLRLASEQNDTLTVRVCFACRTFIVFTSAGAFGSALLDGSALLRRLLCARLRPLGRAGPQ